MTTIYLIRHAEAEGNLYRRVHGWYDSLVTDNGWQQIAALEKRFDGIQVDAVYASDLFRTQATASAISRSRGLALQIDPGLREINMGDWEDQPWGYIHQHERDELHRFNASDPTWRARNGENLEDIGQRAVRTILQIAQRHPDQTIALFSHGTAIRQFLANVKGVAPEDWKDLGHSDNTAVTCLAWDGTRFHIIFESDNSHLDDSISTLANQAWWRKGSKAEDVNLWFRPINWETESRIYLEARREFWLNVHGPSIPFDGDGFLQAAQTHLAQSPWCVAMAMAMAGEEMVGLLELDLHRFSEDNSGYIPFCYMTPEHREHSLGVQLIGQAVSIFRPLGRDKLRLRCAPYNDRAQHFYAKYGFKKIGEETGSRVPLDILEKYIGYEW